VEIIVEHNSSSRSICTPRSKCLSIGTTHNLDTPQGKALITANKDEAVSPFEVFANAGKAESSVAALSEALGRFISGWLRISENPLRMSEEIVIPPFTRKAVPNAMSAVIVCVGE
jgi:hypothetical protein